MADGVTSISVPLSLGWTYSHVPSAAAAAAAATAAAAAAAAAAADGLVITNLRNTTWVPSHCGKVW